MHYSSAIGQPECPSLPVVVEETNSHPPLRSKFPPRPHTPPGAQPASDAQAPSEPPQAAAANTKARMFFLIYQYPSSTNTTLLRQDLRLPRLLLHRALAGQPAFDEAHCAICPGSPAGQFVIFSKLRHLSLCYAQNARLWL